MKNSLFICFVFIFLLSNCASKVEPNEWVVSTGTCWNTYTVSVAGAPFLNF